MSTQASSSEPFILNVVVAEADIDELGHASNIAYVRWIQDAALAHSVGVGLGFEEYRKLGGIFFVRRHEIDYLRPVLRGDPLELRTWIDSVAAAKCVRSTEIATQDGTIVCEARTTWGFVDLGSGRPIRIPQAVRAAFGFVQP